MMHIESGIKWYERVVKEESACKCPFLFLLRGWNSSLVVCWARCPA